MKSLLLLVALFTAQAAVAATPITLPLWPEGVPGKIAVKPADPAQKPNPN